MNHNFLSQNQASVLQRVTHYAGCALVKSRPTGETVCFAVLSKKAVRPYTYYTYI